MLDACVYKYFIIIIIKINHLALLHCPSNQLQTADI